MKFKLLLMSLFAMAFSWSQAQSTIEITTSGGSFPGEKWISITDMADGQGNVIWDQGGMPFGSNYGGNSGLLTNEVVNLPPGTYWVNCYDQYADGWDGTLISVTSQGSVIGDNGGVSPDDGTDNDATFAFGDTQADELEASFQIVVPAPPACLPPTGIAVSNIQTNSVDITWNAQPNAVDYDVLVVNQGDGPTGTPVFQDAMVTGTMVTATGLTALANYDIFITTNCGATDGISAIEGPIPFFVGVQSTIEITTSGGSFAGEKWVSITDMADGAGTVLWDQGGMPFGSNYGGNAGLLTNEAITLPPGTYWVNCYDSYDDGWDGTLINVTAYSAVIGDNGGVSPNDGTDTDVSFAFGDTQADELEASFQIIVPSPPTCLPAADLAVSNIGTDTADITWTAVSNAVDYNVLVVAQGDGPSGTPIFQDTAVVGTTVQATGLSASTSYDVYITTNCGATDGLSTTAGPVALRTECPSVFTAPYFTDFEDFNAGVNGSVVDGDSCWNEISTTAYAWNADNDGGTGSSDTGPSAAFSGTTFIYTEASNGSNGDIAAIESPDIDVSALSVPALFFQYHMYGDAISSLDIYVSSDSGVTYTLFNQIVGQQQSIGSDPWLESILDLSAYAGQTIRIKFESTKIDGLNGGSNFEGDVSIDDFKIDEAPPCLRPSNLVASNGVYDSVAGTSSIDLAWTAGGPMQNTFDIVIVPAGGTVTGSTVPTHPGITGVSTTIGNLAPGLRFDAYVRADCGPVDGVSFYAGPTSFRTPGPGDICAEPFALNVEPDCSVATPFNLDLTNAVDLGTGFASCAGTGPNLGAWFDFGVGRGQSSVTINASEATQFALFDACSGNELRCGNLSSGSSATVGDLDPRTDYKLVIWSTAQGVPSVDICLEEGPSCVAPYDIALVNAIVDTATISFTPGETSQDTFNFLVFDAGDDPLVATPIIDDQGVVIAAAPYEYTTANVLVQGQFYDIYITSDCSGGANTDVSTQVGPLTFRVDAPGESCNAAIALTVNADCNDPAAVTYTFDPSTSPDLGTSFASCDGFGANNGLWFEFVAPASGSIIASFSNSIEFVVLDDCNGSEFACGQGAGTGVVDNLVSGQTYKMALWSDSGSAGPTVVCVEEGPDCSAPLTPDYLEVFDNYTGTSPSECWYEATGGDEVSGPTTVEGSVWGVDGFGNNGTTGSARINIYTTNRSGWIVTRPFDLSAGGYEVNVDVALTVFAGTGQGTFDVDDKVVLVYTEDDGTTWNEVTRWDVNNQPTNTGNTFNGALMSTGSNVRFAFFASSGPTNPGFEDNDFFVDNFQIRTIPSCPDTRNLVVDMITGTTANITFESGSSSSSGDFEYAVTAPGAGVPTAATGSWNDPAAVGQPNPSITYTIMNLTSNTEYEVYVREVCGAGDVSEWTSRPQFFRTACDTFIPRYFEQFDNYTGDVPADCWAEAEGGDETTGPVTFGSSLWTDDGFGNNGTSGSPKINIYTTDREGWIVSPVFDLSGDVYQLNVDVSLTEWSDTAQGTFDVDDKVVLVYTQDGGATWNEITRWAAGTEPLNTGETYNTTLPTNSSSVQFAFFASSGPTNPGFQDNDFFIDNFEVRNIPTCPDILDLSLFSANSNDATIRVESGADPSSGNFEYALLPPGVSTPPVATGSWNDPGAVGQANPVVFYTIPNLTPSTSYDIYVREVCAPGDESLWEGPITVTTECEAISSYPHSANFMTNMSSPCWDEGEGGSATNGFLTGGSSDWKADDYLDAGAGTIASSSLNMFGNSTVNWLITEQYDLNNMAQVTLNVTSAVTAFDDPTTPEAMGSDDTVELAYLDVNDPTATWTVLETWNASNTPALNGTPSMYNITALSGGVYRFAFIGSTNASDLEDFDFHVSQFEVDAVASNASVSQSLVLSLYPNPVKGDSVTIGIAGEVSAEYNVVIYNSLGQQVFENSVKPTSNRLNIEGLNGFNAGLYFVKVQSDTIESTIKFIKE